VTLPDGGARPVAPGRPAASSSALPRVVATDLDGTLLRSDGTVSDRTRTALEGAWAAGISTVFVTARPPRWLDDLVDHVGDHGIAICGNGAFVYDVAEQQVIESRGFSTADLLTLAGDLRQEIPGIRFAVERADGMGSEDDYVYREETAGTTRGPLEELAATTVGKLLARSDEMSSEDFLRAVAGVVGDRANLGFSGAIGLAELTAPGVTKAAGLSIWCSEQGIGPDQVVACGDMPNDLPMLEWAGHAVAVANAHPDVLAVAHEVVASNDDDGVADVLEHLSKVR